MVEVLQQQTDKAGNHYTILSKCIVPIDGTLRVANVKRSLLQGNLTIELVKSKNYGLQIVIALWGGKFVERQDLDSLPHNRIEISIPAVAGKRLIENAAINLQR